MATKPASGYTNHLAGGELDPLKHDVQLLVNDSPEANMIGPGYEKRPVLEIEIGQLLDKGYTLAAFNTVSTAEGQPVCVALMIKRPTQ